VGRSATCRLAVRLPAGRKPSEIPTVARPGGRLYGEGLVVMKKSEIIGINAS
jgi:hypothetical protein